MSNSPLFQAVSRGSVAKVKAALAGGADPNAPDDRNQVALYHAAEVGRLAIVEVLLEAGANVEGYGHGAMTPLMIAVHQARTTVVERLLAAGADVNARTTEGGTALHRAAGQGQQELVRRLLELGADPDAATDDGHTPLHLAIRRAKMGVVRLLLDRGADVDSNSRDGRTALFEAVLLGRAKLLQVFLDAGADPNPTLKTNDQFFAELTKGATPLMIAAHRGQIELIVALLAAGADSDAVNDRGQTALEVAEGQGHGAAIDRLRPATKDARPIDPKSLGPRLARSAAEGREEDVRALLAAGADPDGRDPQPGEQGRTALIAACQGGHLGCVRALLAAGADVDASTTPNAWLGATTTPLGAAAAGGHLEVVRTLLAAGAAVDSRNDHGEAPLLRAAERGHAEVVRVLLGAGADPAGREGSGDEVDEEGLGPPADALTRALINGHSAVLAAFQDAGARPSAEALIAAARDGAVDAVRRLLDAGLDVNARGHRGETALHAACGILTTVVEDDPAIDILAMEDNARYLDRAAVRAVGCVELLLERGADPKARDAVGRTPLHVAASMESCVTYVHAKDPDGNKKHTSGEIDTAPLVSMLLGRGADPDAADVEGITPLMLACRANPHWSRDPSNVIRALLDVGAAIDAADARGRTALFAAAETAEATARLLLAAEASVRARDAEGRTPLLHAVEHTYDQAGLVSALIEAGADVEARDVAGRSALDRAKDQHDDAIVKRLKAAGAKGSRGKKGEQGRKLYDAVAAGDVAKVRAALAAGADPHEPAHSWDPFALAVSMADAEVVRALLDAGADVHRRYPSAHDGSPLLIALENGQFDHVPTLLDSGADPNARDRRGWSALTYAAGFHRRDLVDRLRAAGAEVDPIAADFLAVLDMAGHAATPEFERAVGLVREATGAGPRPIEWLEGACAFFVTAEAETDEALRQPGATGLARFGVEWNVLDAKVRRVLEDLRPRLAPLGALLLDLGRPIGCGPSGKFVVLLPTTEPFTALAACGPAPDGRGRPDVVAWFRELGRTHPFTLWGAGRDFVDVSFNRPVEDAEALANRIYDFCPDSVTQGAGTKGRLARQIREHGRVFFWWD